MNEHARPMSVSEQADELEENMMHELERIGDQVDAALSQRRQAANGHGAGDPGQEPWQTFLDGPDPRLPPMPEKPTLVDYFRNRFASTSHLLQSANHALKAGHSEKVILACLLHDIAVVSFIRCDHGYWGAQMIEPYVDEEVAWAIKVHQALRFFPTKPPDIPTRKPT